MTLQQLRLLEQPRIDGKHTGNEAAATSSMDTAAPAVAGAAPAAATGAAAQNARPVLPAGIAEHFLVPRRSSTGLRYRPALGAFIDVAYRSTRYGVDETRPLRLLVPLSSGPTALDWERTTLSDVELDELAATPQDAASFEPLPPEASQPRNYTAWGREAQRWIQANIPLTLLESKSLKTVSRPGEREAEFRMRLADLRRDARDADVERIQKR